MKHDSLIDPVCGMTVSGDTDHHLIHQGAKVLFCSDSCQQKFVEDPDRYLNPANSQLPISGNSPGGSPGTGSVSYTCPMHPEIQQQDQGSCPKCGMALEAAGQPVVASRTQYTCPMHPEIIQDEPGSCPKCGMALEPVTISVEEKNEELIDMTRRFWVSTFTATDHN